jgi:hypothetical protein
MRFLFSTVKNPVPKFPQALWSDLIVKISKTTKTTSLEENILFIKRPNNSRSTPEVALSRSQSLKDPFLTDVRNFLYKTSFFVPSTQYMNSSNRRCLMTAI